MNKTIITEHRLYFPQSQCAGVLSRKPYVLNPKSQMELIYTIYYQLCRKSKYLTQSVQQSVQAKNEVLLSYMGWTYAVIHCLPVCIAKVQKSLCGTVVNELFPHYNPFLNDETLQAYRYSIVMSRENDQKSYIPWFRNR